MTYKEALIYFKDDLKDGKCSNDCPQCNAMEKAVEALEKQIPKKPTRNKKYVIEFLCPVCGCRSISKSGLFYNHCYICGQAIDWNTTEE